MMIDYEKFLINLKMKKYIIGLALLAFSSIAFSADKFVPIQDAEYFNLVIQKAVKKSDFNGQFSANVIARHKMIGEGTTNINKVYNYALGLYKGLRDSITDPKHKLSKAGRMLLKETEDSYLYTLAGNENHGRANIMYGMLLNDEGKHSKALDYLIKGMKLPKGSNDWMIASSEFVKASFYLHLYKRMVYRKAFAEYKKQAATTSYNRAYHQALVNALSKYFES